MVTLSQYPGDPRPRRAVEALLAAGMAVDLVCLRSAGAPLRESRGKLTIFRLPIVHRRGGLAAYAYEYSAGILMTAAIFAARSIQRRYHVVYVHNMPDLLVVTGLFPKALGARLVLDVHDPVPELTAAIFNANEGGRRVALMKRIEKWSFARADRIITVNKACKSIFSQRSCRPDKVTVVMNTPDEQIFTFRPAGTPRADPPASPARQFVIMYHGSLVARNGLHLVVDAMKQLRKTVPGVILRVYGARTPYLDRVLADAAAQGLEKVIHYLGPRSLEDLVKAIDAADVGVVPNEINAFTEINTPTRLFEYLARGKPVVAPRTAGIVDYFGSQSLVYFRPGDGESLSGALSYVFTHYTDVHRVVASGQDIYLQHTWVKERETLIDAIQTVLAE